MSQCENTRNGELFCSRPTRFITLVCPVCRQRFDYVLCNRCTPKMHCARDNTPLGATT